MFKVSIILSTEYSFWRKRYKISQIQIVVMTNTKDKTKLQEINPHKNKIIVWATKRRSKNTISTF